MSIGIIAEYNPFHNGHKYQLEMAKKRFPGEKIIIIMSGKYVQRGEIAIASFEERKKIALKNGADIVVELPFIFATQAAHIFASGAIKIIYDLGIKKIFFGSESNDPKMLMLIAYNIHKNLELYNSKLKKNLKMGYSFPKAAAKSLSNLIGYSIELPNDILGLEYCKAIIKNNYPIIPHTLKRTIKFNSNEPNGQFASASFIRSELFKGNNVSKYTPMTFPQTFERIEDYYGEFQKIVKETSTKILAKNKMMSEGMENLFKKHITAKTYDEFVKKTTSKRYTFSRIKRVMLYVLLEGKGLI